ncbi:MAG: ImmA/IrrE family metallo-endopeptidase [Brevinematia bacterium]
MKRKKDEIEKMANFILKKLKEQISNYKDIREFLEKVVEYLGGRIEISNTPVAFEEENGSLLINPDGTFVIYLSPITSPLRDNFTIAHELGHYFLHYPHGNKPPYPVKFTRFGGGILETEANMFAASFLMPEEEMKKAIKEYGKENILLIASKFNVSYQAVEIRLKTLGYD